MSDTEINGAFDSREDEQQPAPTAMPGAQLAARRNELGISVEQVANQLNLAPRQILAIESDNYAALPGMASVRGFIRSYAKLLRIDPAPLLAAIASEATPLEETIPLRRALPAQPFSDNRFASPDRGSKVSKPLIVAVSVLAVLAGLYAIQRAGWLTVIPESLSDKMGKGVSQLADSARGTATADVPTGLAPDAGPAASAATFPPVSAGAPAASSLPTAGVVSPLLQPISPTTAGPTASATATLAQPAPSTAPAAAPGLSSVGSVTDARDLLQLKVREDSWIEIRRADHTAVISRLVKAGSVESFKVSDAVSLTVGNATGVDATLRGAPLDLVSDAKSNVARVTVK